MTSFGQYPLVYQLKQQGDGSFIPAGLAEASAFPSLSAVNLVVSSIKADVYVDIPAAFNFTGILTVTSIGAGTSIVDDSDPNNPKFRSILTPTDNFLTPGLNPGNNEVTIGFGSVPLSIIRGGTGLDSIDEGQIIVGTGTNTTGKINAPTVDNTFLQWDGASFIWTGVEPGGAASFPSEPGRIPYTVNTTTLGTADWLTIETGTGRFNVCEVYAVGPVHEGGVSLVNKYQACDVVLNSIASLNPVADQLIYFNGINTATTAAITDQGRQLLDDTTFAAMRTTLELGNVATRSITSPPAGGLYFENDPTGTFTTDTDLTFDKGTNTLKSPSVCATTVCATTIQEGGQTLTSKYLTQANAAVTYQPCDVFLETLSNQGWVDLNSADVCNTLPVTNGGTGLNTISDGQIVVGTGTNTIGTIAAPTVDTYLRYNGANFAWSVIPTGTGTTLPSDACAVVFMNTIGDALTSNPAIRVNNIASTLEIFSDAAAGTGGLDLLPGSLTEGNVRWDPDYHSLSIEGENETRIILGVDDIIPVLNQTGSTIRKGQVAYVSGSSGGTYRGTISLLSDTTPDPFTLGVCLKDIANGANGYLLKKGLIKNAAISDVVKTGISLTEGDTLYVSDQAGKITNVAPGAGKHAATIGIFLASGGANISYGVTVDQGYDLADLHDVNANPTSDGETLVWNTAGYYNAGTINDITGTLTVAKGGTGRTSFNADQIIYGNIFAQSSDLTFNGTILKSPTVCATTVCAATFNEGGTTLASKYLTQANAAVTYQPCDVFLTTLANQGNVDLAAGGQVLNALPISNGGTNKSSFTNNGAIVFYDNALAGSFAENSNLTFLSNILKSPTVCATVVCATTFNEGGTSLVSKYLTQADAVTNYVNKSTTGSFALTANLGDLAYLDSVNLTGTEVVGTLPVTKGGTGRTSFIANRLIYGDAFDQDPNLTFDGTVLKSPTVCGTTVCGTTILESGQSLASKYLTQANAATTYQPVNAKLHQVTAVTTEGLLYFNGTSYASQVTSTYATPGYVTTQLASYTPLSITGQFETTANAQATYLGKSAFNSWSGELALSGDLLDVQITSPTGGQALKWDNSLKKWTNQADDTGLAGGSPGGGNKNVQINYDPGIDSPVFSGNDGLTYDLTTSTLRAEYWSNLPSGSPIWNANQLSGIPLVSALAGGNAPTNGNTLIYLDGGGYSPGWYYDTAGGGSPGGSTTQIQFNNTGSFSGSPALTWDNSTSTLISKQLSATTYLNLPSGTATWNANKIQGIPVTITSDTAYDILLSNGSNFGYVNFNLLTLAGNAAAGWNAAQIQGTFVSSTPPTRNNQLLAYNTSVSQWTAGLAVSSGSGAPTGGVDGDIYIQYFASGDIPCEIGVACSDETTNLTSGTAKATFRMPYTMYLTEVRANVNTAPVGSTIIVDIHKNGSTILSTKVSIDASEKTSKTAASAAVISSSTLTDDDEITVNIDQVGSSTAGKGLKIWLIGTRA